VHNDPLIDEFISNNFNTLKIVIDNFPNILLFGDHLQYCSNTIDHIFHDKEVLFLITNEIDVKLVNNFKEYSKVSK